MAAPKLFQPYISPPHIELLTVYHKTQVIASQNDAELGRVIVPCGFKILRVDFDLTVAGSSGTVTDLKALVGASVVSEILAPAAGAGQKTGSMDITAPQSADYGESTVLKITADTALNTTIDSVALTVTIVPTVP